jgi:RNA polymerase sigma-70 factor (ECF subfamily)
MSVIDNAGENAEELSPYPDQHGLVSRAQSGDDQAFSMLMEPHLHRIYLTAKKITGNHEDAEDACQESMFKAYVHIQRFQGNAKFSTWLTRIVINEALMTVRKMKVESRYRVEGSDIFEMPYLLGLRDRNGISDPEALCVSAERKALLWEAIDHLETKSRSAVYALGLEEKGTWQIAEASQLSRSGVRSRLQRALRKLRAMLSGKLNDSPQITARGSKSKDWAIRSDVVQISEEEGSTC